MPQDRIFEDYIRDYGTRISVLLTDFVPSALLSRPICDLIWHLDFTERYLLTLRHQFYLALFQIRTYLGTPLSIFQALHFAAIIEVRDEQRLTSRHKSSN